MSFTGDLEHLSIVDVVQLLHSTRKSGTLSVTSAKGECQLVFDDGYIISANHFDNSLRIGRILVEAGAITGEDLDATLAEQAAARGERKPLVAALIESGRVKKEDAYRGLETLLELTIVEVLTWTSGHFDLDVGAVTAADDYRYFPEKLHQGIQFHTENVLMDALRIYDEKKRDGKLAGEVEITEEAFIEAFGGEEEAVPVAELAGGEEDLVLSPDDLGLEDVDGLDRRIPEVFKPLEDRTAPGGAARRALAALAPALPEVERDRLAAILDALPARPRAADGPALSVVLYGGDDLFAHCFAAACRSEGILVFSTSEEGDIGPVVAQCLAKGGVPLLVLDAPAAADVHFAPKTLAELRRRAAAAHPGLCCVQLAAPGGPDLPGSPDEGVLAVCARPPREAPAAALVDGYAAFLATFPGNLRAARARAGRVGPRAGARRPRRRARLPGRLLGRPDPAAHGRRLLRARPDPGRARPRAAPRAGDRLRPRPRARPPAAAGGAAAHPPREFRAAGRGRRRRALPARPGCRRRGARAAPRARGRAGQPRGAAGPAARGGHDGLADVRRLRPRGARPPSTST